VILDIIFYLLLPMSKLAPNLSIHQLNISQTLQPSICLSTAGLPCAVPLPRKLFLPPGCLDFRSMVTYSEKPQLTLYWGQMLLLLMNFQSLVTFPVSHSLAWLFHWYILKLLEKLTNSINIIILCRKWKLICILCDTIWSAAATVPVTQLFSYKYLFN
jgi:hypothetical protein